MTIAKKIALITGGKIHKEERETPLSSLNERVIAKSLGDGRLVLESRFSSAIQPRKMAIVSFVTGSSPSCSFP